MEIIKQNIEIEDCNLTKANYIYYNLDIKKDKTEFGYLMSEIRLKNGNSYCIVIESNSNDKKAHTKNYTNFEFDKIDETMDWELIKEFFLNKNDNYLKFKNEAYFMVINKDNKDETKFVFTDYNDVIEYLEMIENQSSSMRSSPL